MIEGLRLLPWLQEQIRNDKDMVERYLDCDKCMRDTEIELRQDMGCGLIPLTGRARSVWMHRGYVSGGNPAPTTCAGYTTKLPEVIEINRARLHWGKGSLREFCGSSQPTENLQRGIEILEGAANEANCWRPDGDK